MLLIEFHETLLKKVLDQQELPINVRMKGAPLCWKWEGAERHK
jgi:hypothetical protein